MMKKILLWKNNSPETAISEATYNIDMSKYSYILIGFKNRTSNDDPGGQILYFLYPVTGQQSGHCFYNCMESATRPFTISSDSLKLTVAYWGSSYSASMTSTSSNIGIPYEIYGLK